MDNTTELRDSDIILTNEGYMPYGEYKKIMSAYNKRQENQNRRLRRKERNARKRPMVYGALGFIMAFFLVGLPFSIIGLATANNRLKRGLDGEDLQFAKNMSAIGIALNSLFLFFGFIVLII